MLHQDRDPVQNGVIGAVQIQNVQILRVQCIAVGKSVSERGHGPLLCQIFTFRAVEAQAEVIVLFPFSKSRLLHKLLRTMIQRFAVWGSAVALYILKNDFVMELSLSSLFAFVVIGYICLIFELQLRAIQTGEKERITLKKYFGSLLNPETFQILLALKPQIGKMVSRDIALHNQKEGSNELMIVTNPNCKNCASVHRHMVEIASSVPVSLVLVTFPNDRLGEEIAQIIIAAYYVVGWDRAIELLGEWYENRHMEDAGIYSITAEVRDVWTKQQIYCREQKISKTPSVIVNKHYVPEVYPLSDLRYVLT